MATLEEEMLARRMGFPNFATLRQRERNARIREYEEANRKAQGQHAAEQMQRQRAGAPVSLHTFTIIGGDDDATRAARMERRVNWGQSAEKAEGGGTAG